MKIIMENYNKITASFDFKIIDAYEKKYQEIKGEHELVFEKSTSEKAKVIEEINELRRELFLSKEQNVRINSKFVEIIKLNKLFSDLCDNHKE